MDKHTYGIGGYARLAIGYAPVAAMRHILFFSRTFLRTSSRTFSCTHVFSRAYVFILVFLLSVGAGGEQAVPDAAVEAAVCLAITASQLYECLGGEGVARADACCGKP